MSLEFKFADTFALPALTDAHVHFREPGTPTAEDLASGTRAALGGGVTATLDMVNNKNRRTNAVERVEEKWRLAAGRIYGDYGNHYGFQPDDDNIHTFQRAVHVAFGLKSMLDVSTGNDRIIAPQEFEEGWEWWARYAAKTQPIIIHPYTPTLAETLAITAGKIGHPTHVTHIANEEELCITMEAQDKGWPVTCGLTPHHFLLDPEDAAVRALGWFARMKPFLATARDRAFFAKHLDRIAIFETDHAPHPKEEKETANRLNPDGVTGNPDLPTSYGVPGVELMLPLLLQAVGQGKLTPHQLVQKTSTRPREIYGLPKQTEDTVVVAMDGYRNRRVTEEDVLSKCGWTPYLGQLVSGKVVEVTRRYPDRTKHVLYDHGAYAPPEGRILRPQQKAENER